MGHWLIDYLNSSHYVLRVKRYTGRVPKQYGQACPVARSLEFLGERWTLLIVRDLLHGPRKFQDLQESLTGVAPAVLSDRLKLLEAQGVVSRSFYSEHPPRAEYALTERGVELRPVVGALAIWGSRHLHTPSTLVHADCDTPLDMSYYCPACERRVGGAAVRFRPAAKHARRKAAVRRRRPSPRA
jgi:DNA-binding HxlR family transcriptional regulator